MRAKQFNELLDIVSSLTQTQRRKLIDVAQKASAIDDTVAVINERVTPEHSCPHCNSQRIHRWSCEDAIQRYRCQDCQKTFNSLTGTPLARLKQRDAWSGFAQSMLDGLSVRKAANAAGIHRTTSFRWRHRLLAVLCERKDGELSGIVEADENYFLESFKGCHEMPRKSRKRGGSAAKRGLSAEQIPVLVVRDRNGEHFDTVLPATDKATLGVLLPQLLTQHSVRCTDGAGVYKAVAKEQGIAHESLNIKAVTRVRQRVFHIQNVNAYDSRLKGWMARFRGVATRHLPNHLGWRRLLDKEGANLTAIGFLRYAMG